MNGANRNWIIGAVLLMVVVLVGGWFLGLQPQFAAAAAANSDEANIEASNALAEVELARLKAQDEALPQLQKDLDKLEKSIPSRAVLATYTAELAQLAAASGVTLVGATFDSPLPFVPGAGYETLVPPSVDPTKLVVITMKVSTTGPRDNLNNFLKALQTGSRLSLVSQFVFANGPDGLNWGLDITGAVFVLLDPDGPKENIPPVDPNATPTPTPTPTAEPTETSEPTPSPTDTPAG